MTDRHDEHGPATRLLHLGEGAASNAAPLTVPVYETSTFVFENAEALRRHQEGLDPRFVYSRYANPTVVAVEKKLASLEGAEQCLVCGSGMGAIATAMAGLLKAGDELVLSSALYGGTVHLVRDLLEKFGVHARTVDLADVRGPESAVGERTRMLWFESPVNPTLRCVDIRAIAATCRACGVLSVIDNTFASPVNQRPLALGVDLVMHSATKYLNGHSDVTAGALLGSEAVMAPLRNARKLLGTVLAPSAAYALGRGLKTLFVRVARQNASAMAVARFLEGDRRVGVVFYPGLESHPDHDLARQQMSGFGGMVCFDLDGDYERACRFFDRLKVFKRAASLGGVESLCSLPVLTSQWGLSAEELARAGVTPGMVRLSVGLEDEADLVADLDQALGC